MRAALGLLLMLMLLAVVSPLIIAPRASPVGGLIRVPGDYGSIQAAIDAAQAGSEILVGQGEYIGSLVVNKNLTIIGSGNSTVIVNSDASDAIHVERGADGVSLADFLVNGSGVTSGGIYIGDEDCTVENVTVANYDKGIFMWDSSENTLRNDRMINNSYNLEVWGLFLSHFMQNIDGSNFVDGREVCYLVNQRDKTVPSDAGFVGIVNSTNITIKDVNMTHNYSGILLAYTTNSLVLNDTCSQDGEGLLCFLSDNNTIVSNRFSSNVYSGINLCACSNNFIAGNSVKSSLDGIDLEFSTLLPNRSEYNTLRGNTLMNSTYGLYVDGSSRNTVYNNEITNDTVGAYLDSSGDSASENVFVNNSFSGNTWCNLRIDGASGNDLYHNALVSNTLQVTYVEHVNLPTPVNEWDNGYPTGGNFWSDYDGTDQYSGPYQNQTGSDGIGDSPYIIDSNNVDRYPLMGPPSVNTVLDVSFSYYPEAPKIFEVMNFVDKTKSPSGIALSLWVFSDNQIFETQNVTRQFAQSQNYTVVLYTIDAEGITEWAQETFQVRKFFSNLTLTVQRSAFPADKVPIQARLKVEDSGTLSNATIDFYIIGGTSKKWIGSSETNSTGQASTNYSFTETGTFTVEAEFEGDQLHDPSNCEVALTVSSPQTTSPLLVGITISCFAAVALILLYAYRGKRPRRDGIVRER